MTRRQRMRSDIATIERREMDDKLIRDNRVRNDDLTWERRDLADRTLEKNRSRNDQMTSDRREIKDGNLSIALAVSLVILLTLAVGFYFIFI